MRISFSPQRRDDTLSVTKQGDALTINGQSFSFFSVPEGGTIPAGEVPCEWIVGPVERVAGEIHLTLILPHGSNPSQSVAFPEPIIVAEDGPIAVPHDEPVETEGLSDVDA